MPRYPALSQASHGLSSSVYTSLLALAQQHAPEVFPLHVGDTHLLPPACARAEALRVSDLPRLHNYADVTGDPELVEAIAYDMARRGRPLDTAHLQVTAGATSGLDLVCRALFAPGDEVLVLAPYWPLIRGIVTASGARAVEVPFFTELDKPDFDVARALESKVTAKTAGIYINQPHNPTGVVLSDAQIDVLADFAEAHDLWVLSDEAYERLSFSAQAPQALYAHPRLGARTLAAHTFSKTYGLAGARVGFVHGAPEGMRAVRDLQTYATYCAARPMQIAAARALRSPQGEAFVAEARQSYRTAAERSARVLGVATPQAGTFAFFDTRPFRREGESAQALLARCAKVGVVLTPGAVTGSDYGDWARLCFTSVPLPTLDRALRALDGALRGPH